MNLLTTDADHASPNRWVDTVKHTEQGHGMRHPLAHMVQSMQCAMGMHC